MNRRSFLRGLLVAPVAVPAAARQTIIPLGYPGPPPYPPLYGYAHASITGQDAMKTSSGLGHFPQFGELIETPYGYDTGWMGGCVCDGASVELWSRA